MLELINGLFEGYGSLAMIVFAVGIIFCIVEIFVPGFGVFGIVGTIFILAGVIARYLIDFNLEHLIVMIIFVITVISLSVVLMVSSAKHGLLEHSPIIENKTSIATSYSNEDDTLIKLLGKVAFTSSVFRPAGKFSLDGESYDAFSYGEFIEKGVKIQVVEVKDGTIYIKRV